MAASDAQQQPKAPTAPAAPASNPNLDMLQSMMNLILIQSGRFIKEHQAGGGTGRMKMGMQRTVPIATERFHDALDELENEVLLAQTVLRRDLAVLKENRKKREAAAKQHEAERLRQAAEAKIVPPPPPPKEDAPIKIEKVATPKSTEPATTEPDPVPQASDEDAILKREDNHVPPPIKTDNEEPARDPLFDGTPTTANPHESEFDFEAMFGDSAMDTGGDDTNQDMMMDMSNDLGFSLDDGNDGPSLLRGLEDFAKSSENSTTNQDTAMDMDLPMPDLPDLNTTVDTQPVAPAALAPEPETKKEPTPPPPKVETPKAAAPPPPEPVTETKPEQSTDDANDVMATMAVDDLEDLFNMDEYENPENSSFDDAFFNFE